MDNLDLSGFDLQEKEERIIRAAIKVFSEKGFSASTTSEIARGAGVAEGTIFRYFKTKKDILRRILISAINLFSSKLVIGGVDNILNASGGKDVRAVLKELIYDRLKLVDSFFPIARVIVTEALVHEDIREAIYQNIIVKALDVFNVFYGRMTELGMLRSDTDPVLIFRSILGSIGMLIAQRKLFGDKIKTVGLDDEIEKMLDVLIYGIAPVDGLSGRRSGQDQAGHDN